MDAKLSVGNLKISKMRDTVLVIADQSALPNARLLAKISEGGLVLVVKGSEAFSGKKGEIVIQTGQAYEIRVAKADTQDIVGDTVLFELHEIIADKAPVLLVSEMIAVEKATPGVNVFKPVFKPLTSIRTNVSIDQVPAGYDFVIDKNNIPFLGTENGYELAFALYSVEEQDEAPVITPGDEE